MLGFKVGELGVQGIVGNVERADIEVHRSSYCKALWVQQKQKVVLCFCVYAFFYTTNLLIKVG